VFFHNIVDFAEAIDVGTGLYGADIGGSIPRTGAFQEPSKSMSVDPMVRTLLTDGG